MSLAKKALEMKDTNPMKQQILNFLSGKEIVEKPAKVVKSRIPKLKKDNTTGFISFGSTY
jgi:hypothetical protein